MQRFTCDLYSHFGAFLAPVSVGIITGKHYAKNSGTNQSSLFFQTYSTYTLFSLKKTSKGINFIKSKKFK